MRTAALLLMGVACASAAETINVRDYIVGDGVKDDAPALNQLFASAPDYSEVVFPAGTAMAIRSTVVLRGKSGLRLRGLSGVGNGVSPYTTAPQFLWKGPTGGTMLSIDKSQGLVIENLLFSARDSCVPASSGEAEIGIDVDQSSPNPGGITTDLIFRRIAVGMCGVGRPSFAGIRFSWTSLSNVEHMRVEDSLFNCAGSGSVGSGILMGKSANAKNFKFVRNSFANCEYGIHVQNGSFEALGNMFTTDRVDIYVSGYVDTVNVQGNVTENSQQFFVSVGLWPIELSNNQISLLNTPPGKAAVEVSHAAITAKANKFDQFSVRIAFEGHAGASLASIGNQYPSLSYASTGWASFERGVVTMQDKMIDAATNGGWSTGIAMSGMKDTSPVPMQGLGILYFDAGSRKWLVSEDGKAFVKLIP